MTTPHVAIAVRPRPRQRPLPAWLAAAWLLACAWGAWTVVQSADAASDQGDTQVGAEVDAAIALAPDLDRGDVMTAMPIIRRPGELKTASSDGWRMTTSWVNGYNMWISASTNPALRGSNARDSNEGAPGTFADHAVGGCPCDWDSSGATRGVFGYSLAGDSGFVDSGKWGTSGDRKWRGFTRNAYKIAESSGTGTWDFSLVFRTELPAGQIQPAGDYRANLLLSFVPRT